jgi:methionyl-tRNA formyltransferase
VRSALPAHAHRVYFRLYILSQDKSMKNPGLDPDLHKARAPRILYLGTPGAFSRAPLLALLAAGLEVCGVVVPAAASSVTIARLVPERSRSPLPIANPYMSPGIVQLAWQHGIAAFAASRLADPATAAALADLQPDLACVACFPRRIPAALLQLPPLGWLNIHPSLLPAYRGPAPLFWIFRNGESTAGVTIHFMDQELDAGDIVAQAALALPDGVTGLAADSMCAELGGQLLIDALRRLPHAALERRRQPGGGSYQSWPAPNDWTISTTWPARRIFNFMRGTSDWGRPYLIDAGGVQLGLASAIDYSADAILGAPYTFAGRTVALQCTPGVLRAWRDDA